MNITSGNGTSGNLPFDEGMCERYLLGELSEPEQELFETAYFDDDAFFNRFLAVKDELLDLYARNELDAKKRHRVESHFLTTAPRLKRLAESKEFVRSVTLFANQKPRPVSMVGRGNESKREPFIQSIRRFFNAPALAVAGVLLLLIVASLWMIARREQAPIDSVAGSTDAPVASNIVASNEQGPGKLLANTDTKSTAEIGSEPDSGKPVRETKTAGESEIARKPTADVSSNSTNSAQVPPMDPRMLPPLHTLPTPTPQPHMAEVTKTPEPKTEELRRPFEAVTLSSTSRAMTSQNTVSIGSETQYVSVRLLFRGDAYPSYTIRVSTLGGKTVWSATQLKTYEDHDAKSVGVPVPAGGLLLKDYIVTLQGRTADGKLETIGEYYLHVDRR